MAPAIAPDLAILDVLERVCVEVSDTRRSTVDAWPVAMSTAHIAHALALPPDAPIILGVPAQPDVARVVKGPLVNTLIRLSHEKLVRHERRTVRGVLDDYWAITLEGLARVRRERAA